MDKDSTLALKKQANCAVCGSNYSIRSSGNFSLHDWSKWYATLWPYYTEKRDRKSDAFCGDIFSWNYINTSPLCQSQYDGKQETIPNRDTQGEHTAPLQGPDMPTSKTNGLIHVGVELLIIKWEMPDYGELNTIESFPKNNITMI